MLVAAPLLMQHHNISREFVHVLRWRRRSIVGKADKGKPRQPMAVTGALRAQLVEFPPKTIWAFHFSCPPPSSGMCRALKRWKNVLLVYGRVTHNVRMVGWLSRNDDAALLQGALECQWVTQSRCCTHAGGICFENHSIRHFLSQKSAQK